MFEQGGGAEAHERPLLRAQFSAPSASCLAKAARCWRAGAPPPMPLLPGSEPGKSERWPPGRDQLDGCWGYEPGRWSPLTAQPAGGSPPGVAAAPSPTGSCSLTVREANSPGFRGTKPSGVLVSQPRQHSALVSPGRDGKESVEGEPPGVRVLSCPHAGAHTDTRAATRAPRRTVWRRVVVSAHMATHTDTTERTRAHMRVPHHGWP